VLVPTVEKVTTVGAVAAPLGVAATRLAAAASTAAPAAPKTAAPRPVVLIDECRDVCTFGLPTCFETRFTVIGHPCRLGDGEADAAIVCIVRRIQLRSPSV
jgi:hypothetical protein